jgi:hypothetical protein
VRPDEGIAAPAREAPDAVARHVGLPSAAAGEGNVMNSSVTDSEEHSSTYTDSGPAPGIFNFLPSLRMVLLGLPFLHEHLFATQNSKASTYLPLSLGYGYQLAAEPRSVGRHNGDVA